MKYLLIPFLLACGSHAEDRYTWGDATSEVSEAYCERLATCYGGSPNQCVAHTEFHFCLDGTCDESLPDEAVAEVEACVAALAEADCYLLGYWGVVPEECGLILDREPTE